jgi:hypothetical protein
MAGSGGSGTGGAGMARSGGSGTGGAGMARSGGSKLGGASVTLAGLKVPQDDSIGWSMSSPTELLLNGYACAVWRTSTANIAFNFRCDALRTN